MNTKIKFNYFNPNDINFSSVFYNDDADLKEFIDNYSSIVNLEEDEYIIEETISNENSNIKEKEDDIILTKSHDSKVIQEMLADPFNLTTEESLISSEKKKKSSSIYCIIPLNHCTSCHWKFPKEMIVKEKQAHVNICMESLLKGKINKKNYYTSIKAAIDLNSIYTSENDRTMCPFCFKKRVRQMKKHIERCVQKIIKDKSK